MFNLNLNWSDPKIASRPVTEYLDAIDQDGAPRKKISLTDPTARWTAAIGGQARFTWATNYLKTIKHLKTICYGKLIFLSCCLSKTNKALSLLAMFSFNLI